MKSNEFDAVYRTTDLFAIAACTVVEEVPHHLQRQRKSYGGGYTCPIGLVRARVMDTKAEWTSTESFGCGPGASTHEVTHRNGVLVEISLKEAEGIKERRYCRKSGSVVTMVVLKKAIIMPWSDYQPVRDARRKSQRESERRGARMASAINAVGATRGSWNEYRVDGKPDYVFDDRRADVDVPLIVVEQIAVLLAVAENDPAQVPYILADLKTKIEQMPDVRAAVSEAMEGKKKRAKRK